MKTKSQNNPPVAVVDCNNFYASCERVFNPKLLGKPVVVLSNNDGIIVALSNEAKAVGIKMGDPLFKVQDLVKKHDVNVFSSNYVLYGDISHRIMTTLEQFSPNVEIYSIDEAFISLEGFKRKNLTEYCREIRETVKKWIGIPVSVGIAETKTLSKIANRIAKKNPKYDGVLNIYGIAQNEIDEYLKITDVSDVWGVGHQYTKLLKKNNINTAYDLTKANDKWVKNNMTVMGLRTVYELRGIPCVSLESAVPDKKAIICSRSFGRYVETIEEIKESVSLFTTRAAEKMRSQNSACRLLTVFLRTNPFKKTPQYHNGVLVHLPVPSDSTTEMISYAMKGVEQIFRKGYLYQKVGVMLTGFEPVDRSQLGLFDSEDRIKMAKVTETMDRLNLEFGSRTLFYASSGIKRSWGTKSDMKSPQYTTDWENLPEVSA
ncbi:MAG: SOS mutagenesis and repair protein UmuC [Ignavibacteria bacterium GWB2_35_12]|nr:MAG: SOS mutagenesis and repair protein UmuC [Ignavibacteria bacterium GWB2_35_12]OGU88518.1 MAG: SOS mutagenesis and repair protein UmuC [Ignavibacteria bacterium RIFOXYA2_FULL_35_10]OGV20268.1 MAG: SOS mutagenesis and repair protein UmuC [Ignavibacteria bacterium RIFOXYC2_FULL_35_21]